MRSQTKVKSAKHQRRSLLEEIHSSRGDFALGTRAGAGPLGAAWASAGWRCGRPCPWPVSSMAAGLYLGPSSAVRWAGARLPYPIGVTGCPGPGAFPVFSGSLDRVWLWPLPPSLLNNSYGAYSI